MVTGEGVKVAFHVGCSVGGQAVSGLAVAHKGNEALNECSFADRATVRL